jgi:hypothetical protein
MPEITYTGALTVIGCGTCHIDLAVPRGFLDARKRDGATFYCPVGHKMSYGEGETERLKRRLESANARAIHAEDQRRAAERRTAAYKGQVTKIKKRVGNGVCPCCNRHFANVERHMENKHPGYSDEEGQ